MTKLLFDQYQIYTIEQLLLVVYRFKDYSKVLYFTLVFMKITEKIKTTTTISALFCEVLQPKNRTEEMSHNK